MFPLITNFQTLTGKAPVFLKAEVGLVTSAIVVLTYNKTLSYDSVPATMDFSVGGTLETITALNIYGSTIYLTMSGNLQLTDVLTVSYTKGVNPIQDSSVNESVNLVNKPVVNNI